MTATGLADPITPDPRTLDDAGRALAEAVGSQYSIRREVGRGGMGIVYLARDKRLERFVALKTLPPHLAIDNSVRERFLRETRLAGSLSHPNVVPIYGADEIAGHVFFVMRYIDGESLATRIRTHGRLDALTTVRYLRDVASALAHAHSHGVIHRDIKAENILVEKENDRAVVTDFGIARLAEAAPLTATGQLLGTVYYVSPEQVSGDHVDLRSDLYALGVVGFYALAGRFPFEAELASAVLVAHVTKPAPRLASVVPDAPPALAAIIDRCLAKDPAQRFANAAEVIAVLDSVRPEAARPASDRPPPPRLVSDTEAHALWHRAAELQALTGTLPKPDVAPKVRDADADAARTSGFAVDDIRAAAAEAGITERHLSRALAEHGLGKAPAGSLAIPHAARGQGSAHKRGWWTTGSHFRVERVVAVNGEVTPAAFDDLVLTLNETSGKAGRTYARSRELTWEMHSLGRSVDAAIVSAGGRTAVRVTEDVRPRAITRIVGGPVLGFIAGLTAAIVVDEIEPRYTPREILLLTWGVVFLLSTVTSWLSARREVKQAGARVVALAETVAAKVRSIIADEP